MEATLRRQSASLAIAHDLGAVDKYAHWLTVTHEQKDEVIHALWDLVTALRKEVVGLKAEVASLTAEVAELCGQLAKNSRNSSIPSSAEGLKKTKSMRKKGTHPPGGQALHRSVKGFHLFQTRQGKPFSYWTIRTLWLRATTSAGIEDAHIHDIRAKAATDAKAQGLDSKSLLGHASESAHLRYLRGKETPVAEPVRIRKY